MQGTGRGALAAPFQARLSRLDVIATLAILLLYLAGLVPALGTGVSADLQAAWEAGVAMISGRPDEVYPPATLPFAMLPPEAWLERLRAAGQQGDVFPFLYPPLWAWAMGQLSLLTGFQTVAQVASALNALFLPATVLLAHRVAAPAMPRSTFLLSGMLVLFLPTVGLTALMQNQPQIIVAFLTVLAIERALSGRERSAGAVLAVAAAIKVYPVLLAVLFLASRRYRAAGSFCVVGGALGAFSVAVAGWPLHVAFLDLLATISRSILVTPLTYTVDAAMAQMFMPQKLTLVLAPLNPGVSGKPIGWYAMTKPPALALLGQAIQLAALAGFAWLLWRRPGPRAEAAIWPLAMMVLSLLGPMSWGYHYIAPLAFTPMVLERLRPGASSLLALLGMLLLSVGLVQGGLLPWPLLPRQIVGLLGILCFAAAFALSRPIGRSTSARAGAL